MSPGHWRRSGCSAAWQRASFGTKRSWVQIPPPRQPKQQVRSGLPSRRIGPDLRSKGSEGVNGEWIKEIQRHEHCPAPPLAGPPNSDLRLSAECARLRMRTSTSWTQWIEPLPTSPNWTALGSAQSLTCRPLTSHEHRRLSSNISVERGLICYRAFSSIDGWKIEAPLPDIEDLGYSVWQAFDAGVSARSSDEEAERPGKDLAEYRYRLSRARRRAVGDRLQHLPALIDTTHDVEVPPAGWTASPATRTRSD